MDYMELWLLVISSIIAPAVLYFIKTGLDIAATRAQDNSRITKIFQVESIKAQADAAIEAAIAHTTQHYVDAHKKMGTWTKEAEVEALKLSADKAAEILGPAAMELLKRSVGDISLYLETLIEKDLSGAEDCEVECVVEEV